MNKTVYFRDDEVPLWEKARELSGDKLSPVIVEALRQFIAKVEAQAKGYERIVVEFNDAEDHNLPKKKAFCGCWIIDPKQRYRVDDEFEVTYFAAVAETGKGGIAVTERAEHLERGTLFKFRAYPSVQVAAADMEFRYAVHAAVVQRGVPVEELDI